jgi:hypothetical protein
MDEKENPHGVRLGDVFQDMDVGRPQRRLKVVEIEEGTARVLNTRTERMTRIRLDRLAKRSHNGHGYLLVERTPEAEDAPQPESSDRRDATVPLP